MHSCLTIRTAVAEPQGIHSLICSQKGMVISVLIRLSDKRESLMNISQIQG